MSESLLGDDPTTEVNTETTPPEGDVTPTTELPEWLSGIEGVDTDVVNDPSLKAIKDVPNLIKSFVNAQKLVGAEKAVIPKEGADEQEWSSFFQKLGKPDNFDDFVIEKPEDSSLEEDHLEAFRKAAFENNLLPKQADKLYRSMLKYEADADERFISSAKERTEAAVSELKNEWGEAFEKNVNVARKAAQEFGGDEFTSYLKESGLGNDPKLVKLFAKVGESLFKEDDTSYTPKGKLGITPEDAKREYFEVMNDPGHAWHNSTTPGHKEALDRMAKLFVAFNPPSR